MTAINDPSTSYKQQQDASLQGAGHPAAFYFAGLAGGGLRLFGYGHDHEHAALPEPVTVEQALAYDMAVNHLPWKDAMKRLMLRSEIQRDTAGMLKIAAARL